MNDKIPKELSPEEGRILEKFIRDIKYHGKSISLKLAKAVLSDLSNGKEGTAKFRLYCKKTMDGYEANGKWSQYERKAKSLLESIGIKERVHYLHNFKIQNKEQTGYYSIDMFFFLPKVALEFDGSVWHGKMGNAHSKDYRKDEWLKSLGIRVVRFSNKHFSLSDGILKGLLVRALFDSPARDPESRCSVCRVAFPAEYVYCPLCGDLLTGIETKERHKVH